ncbi:MAG: MFS transporter [Robiginitomaculum sp.]|nr:MAG: MFS transporter [Robiginitomaculum sp.]
MFDRASAVDEAFKSRVKSGDLPKISTHLTPEDVGLSACELVDVFETQIMNRQLDLLARRSKGKTFYSIGSSGHEGMAMVAKASRLTDMAFLHYRDGNFLLQRKKSVPGATPLYDMILSFAAAKDDPISGGRHKVLGGVDVNIPPQTSTIASHLPKAVGAAHSVAMARKLKLDGAVLPEDAIILCSFGDASTNHSTAQGAINAAAWASYQNSPMPIVFICEDNDIGISTKTPKGWIEANYANRPGLEYIACDGTHPLSAYQGAKHAVNISRFRRKPVFLHMKTVRLMGHAGADIETVYTDIKALEANEAKDPLLQTAAHLLKLGILNQDDMLKLYEDIGERIRAISEQVFVRPKLTTAQAVMEPIVPAKTAHIPAPPFASKTARTAMLKRDKRILSKPMPMARQIGTALADILLQYENTFICGEDVARKGGVYGVTRGLLDKFGPARMVDTLLDEQSILGLAIGAAHNGFVPIPEIQFLAYLHNAADQIRGEAATLSFFSNSQYTNPMVVRIAGLAYQKGFGGHFHNDNALAALRDIPGIIVACPSHGDDARKMLRESVRLAHEERRIVIFLEPIALYQMTDLHEEDDGLWLGSYVTPSEDEIIHLDEVGQYGKGKDVCILSYGNGYYLSRQAEKILAKQHGIQSKIVDMRWLQPLPEAAILDAIKGYKHVLIVDECRKTASLSEQILTLFAESGVKAKTSRICAQDSFIPLGAAANTVLVSKEQIIEATLDLLSDQGKGARNV